MDKQRRITDVWLSMQGYRRHGLAPRIKWFGYEGKEFTGQSDPYTLDNNRRKGFVLHRDYLDPELWEFLEYESPTPQSIFIRDLPHLAVEIVRLMFGKELWKGTATELLNTIDSRYSGIPDVPERLGMALTQTNIAKALATKGIKVQRIRTASKRVIVITKTAA